MGGNVVVRLNLNSAGYSAEMAKASRSMRSFADATKEMGHGTVSQMQAASASIRLIEGDMTRNVRAVERFITTIPGIGKALQAAFPLVGAAATLGIIVKIGEEAFKAVQEVRKMGTAIQSGFDQITSSGMLANDQLKVTNEKLQEEINKLEHAPGDGLAVALAQAKVKADELFDSLRKDNEEISKVLEANQSGFLAQVMGKAPSGEVKSSIQGIMNGLENTGRTARDATDPAARAKAKGQLEQQLKAAVAQIEQLKLQNPNGTVGGVDFSGNFNALDSTESVVKQRFDRIQLESQKETLELRKAADEKAKQQQEDAKRAAAAMKQAQEQIVEQWRSALDQDRANALISTDQEAAYWAYRSMTAAKGSLSYKKAIDEANKSIAKINAESMSAQKNTVKKSQDFDQTAGNVGIDRFDLSRGDTEEMKANGNAAVEYLRNLNQGIMLQRSNADAIAEASIQMALMTGQIGKLDAAQAMAALHAKQYNDEMNGIASALEAAQQLPEGFEKSQRIAGLNSARTQAEGQRQVQIIGDSQGISESTIPGAVKTSLNEMVRSFTDMAANIKDVIPRTIEGLNDDVARLVTGQGQKGDFSRTLKGAGEGLVKTGLQAAEGGLLKSLGIAGKRDGSSSLAALWVQIANGSAGIGTSNPAVSAGAGLASLIPGGSFIQPFMKAAMGFLPHFAEGGPVAAGQAIWTGEKGPEPFIPSSSGTIIPNHMLGGGASTHFHIDARGSSDPAAIHAAVMRSAPSIAAAAMQGTHSMSRRKPTGR